MENNKTIINEEEIRAIIQAAVSEVATVSQSRVEVVKETSKLHGSNLVGDLGNVASGVMGIAAATLGVVESCVITAIDAVDAAISIPTSVIKGQVEAPTYSDRVQRAIDEARRVQIEVSRR